MAHLQTIATYLNSQISSKKVLKFLKLDVGVDPVELRESLRPSSCKEKKTIPDFQYSINGLTTYILSKST
jgi:hypothetical protein